MGRLVGLELHNFKSYRGTSSIGFGSSCFTSIIGPNGAGKSNMMDAISFVLGIKSSQLRSQNMKDLIYRGRRGGGAGAQDGEEDGLDVDTQDPSRAYVTCVYEKDDGEELKLQRTITSTGTSEYRVNGKAVTALQYSTILKKENILIKARNFLVFQGDVEQIASQSPRDLTQLIETISGSTEYIKEYETLKEEREKAHEVSNSVFSRKRILNSESKQYKEQLVEQEAFERKLTDKSKLIKLINLYKLFHNERRHDELSDVVAIESDRLKEFKRKLKSEESSLRSLMSDYSKQQLKAKKTQNLLAELQQKAESKKRNIIPTEATKKSLVSKIGNCRNKIRELNSDVSKQQHQLNTVERQLKDAQKLMEQFLAKIVPSSNSGVSAEGQREYESLRAQFLSSNGSQLEETLSLLISERDSCSITISNFDKQKLNSESRITELKDILEDELQGKLEHISNEINDALTLRAKKERGKTELIQKGEQYKYKELELNTQLRDILVKLDDLSSQQRESQKQRKLRENVAMLKKSFPKGAIKGLVSDLVRPSQHKYEAALLTLLGQNFDSIVVETTSVAYKCIETLKERRSGVATFIPLDSVSNDSFNLGYLRSLHENVMPGLDILEYDDPSLEQAIQYVIGDALVADTVETASELKWGSRSGQPLDKKIVTMDGSVIHRSGLMTGGRQAQRSGASLNWDKNEWKNLNELKDELLLKLSKLNEEKPKEMDIKQFTDEINQVDDKLPLLRNQKSNIERIIEDRKSEIDFHREAFKKLAKDQQKKQEKLNEIDEELNETRDEIRQLQSTIYADFCEKYGFTKGIQDYEELHGSALRSRAKERAQFSKAVSTLSSKVDFEKEKLAASERRQAKLSGQLLEYEDQLSELLEEIETLQDECDQVEAEIEVTQGEYKKLNEKLLTKMKSVKSVEANIEDVNSDISEVTKLIISSEESILKVDMERVNILKNCKIESVNLPLKDGLLDLLPIGDDVDSLIKDIYDIQIDYSSVGEKLRESFNAKVEAELQAKLEQVIEDLDQLAPNAKAVERLKDVEVKLREFDKDFTKARQKENKVIDKFNAVKDKRYELFMDAFNHISNQIDGIYKELTKSEVSPLGGSAYLTLEDEDDPYTAGIKYHAMPPMKRFRDMELLSGGEKTIAALALLFAVHSFQPSPFFVLDEVDAALDNSNVSKIANYIRTHAGPNFQFIVISLKNSLFEKSDALVGIYRDQRENSSKTVTLDLREYEDEEPTQVPVGA